MVRKKRGTKAARKHRKEAYGHLAIGIVAILFFSFVALSVGTGFGPSGEVITGHASCLGDFGTCISTLFAASSYDSSYETIHPLFAKWILFFIILMVIYWTLGTIVENNPDNKGVFWGKMLFSVAVAILSIGFIRFDQVISLMTAYSALGSLIAIIVPFALVLALTSRLVKAEFLTVQKILVQKAVWFAYAAFLIYFLISTIVHGGADVIRASPAMNAIIGIIVLVSLYFTFRNKSYVKTVNKLEKMVEDFKNKAEKEQRIRALESAQHDKVVREYVTTKKFKTKAEKELKDMRDAY